VKPTYVTGLDDNELLIGSHVIVTRLCEQIVLEDVLLEGLYYLAEEVFNEEEEKSRNKELPPELLEIVEDALHEGPMDEVLIQKYNVDITRSNLQVLLPGVWLNDEVRSCHWSLVVRALACNR
jgi:hypothetical protein